MWRAIFLALLLGNRALGQGVSDGVTSAGAERLPPAAYIWQLPTWLPEPAVPQDNPMTPGSVALGRTLFFSNALSLNETTSCASCHLPELAYTDGRARAVGATGERHPRNSMSVLNAAYNPRQGWADPDTVTLEEQIRRALFNTEPLELGWSGRESEQLSLLYERHGDDFDGLLGRPPQTLDVVNALATFVRTLVDHNSPYDRYVYEDDQAALSQEQKHGARLFFSDRLNCGGCHSGPHFNGPIWTDEQQAEPIFLATGLGGPSDQGVYEQTGKVADRGRFRVPSLRNIALTAPYMHDGRFDNLDQVLDHYAGLGSTEHSSPVDPRLEGFDLSGAERRALIAFLHSLTGDFAQFSVP